MTPSSVTCDEELNRWVEPFLQRLPRQGQRRWAAIYLKGLLLPGERKSVGPMATRVAPGEAQQLHHFIAVSPWLMEPLAKVLAVEAGRLTSGRGATLVIDEIPLVKQGSHSVGVARQSCGEVERQRNCQVLVSLTLCNDDIAVPVALRLYLPESWCADPEQRRQAGIPSQVQHLPRWRIALNEIDRLRATELRFGRVVATVGFGDCAAFRMGLAQRGFTYTVGAPPTPEIGSFVQPRARSPGAIPLPAAVGTKPARRDAGPVPGDDMAVTWRRYPPGSVVHPSGAWFGNSTATGCDEGEAFRAADRTPTWVGCAEGVGGGRSYYVTNAPELASDALRAQGMCAQAHRELRTELGLDHFEGRSWLGLHHHVTMVMIAFCFLQHLRSISDELRPARDRRGQHSWAVPREGPVGGRAHPHHGGLALGAADAAP